VLAPLWRAFVQNLTRLSRWSLWTSLDRANLRLSARPGLGITFTKEVEGRYRKCVFLDADTLVVANSDELFDREQFSAVPVAGWFDCFNSGVFLFKICTLILHLRIKLP
jgi:hypothetical protein